MKIISIDPSTRDVGWALVNNLLRDENGVWDNSKADWKWGHWKIGSHSLTFKFREIVEWMIIEFGGVDEDDWLVLEWPAFFGSAKGQIAAQQGHTINLAGVDAYIAGFFRLPPMNVHLVTANQWKGNLPKEITRMRFFRALGQKQIYKINHNAVDAVMLLHEFCKRRKIAWKINSSSVELDDSHVEYQPEPNYGPSIAAHFRKVLGLEESPNESDNS